jgi:hypothetical protein
MFPLAALSLWLNSAQERQQTTPDDAALSGVLAKASLYCQKLQNYVYHFVCQEKVSEIIKGAWKMRGSPQISPGLQSLSPGATGGVYLITDTSQKNTYLYEYQLIRKKGINQESRTLIEKNGIRFPSRVFLEEAYQRKKNKKKSVVSSVTIDYKNYQFFTVDVDVNYK